MVVFFSDSLFCLGFITVIITIIVFWSSATTKGWLRGRVVADADDGDYHYSLLHRSFFICFVSFVSYFYCEVVGFAHCPSGWLRRGSVLFFLVESKIKNEIWKMEENNDRHIFFFKSSVHFYSDSTSPFWPQHSYLCWCQWIIIIDTLHFLFISRFISLSFSFFCVPARLIISFSLHFFYYFRTSNICVNFDVFTTSSHQNEPA